MLEKYPQLFSPTPPAIIREAMKLYGVKETPGPRNNIQILAWADEVAQALGRKSLGYNADSIPWCGLYTAVVAVRAGWVGHVPSTPLWARSWLSFGQATGKASLGDVLVFSRGTGGHVGFYVAEDVDCYHVLGGNQSDQVTISRIKKARLLGARRPKWRIAQPPSVKPYYVDMSSTSDKVSDNEA